MSAILVTEGSQIALMPDFVAQARKPVCGLAGRTGEDCKRAAVYFFPLPSMN